MRFGGIERVVNELLDPVAEAGGGNVLEAVGARSIEA